MRRFLPPPFRPKLHCGFAIAGICLIRLEEIRPPWLPRFCGISSENAAHRIAVDWDDPSGESREGVFIPRRDTGSWLNHFAGGRIFPGEHNLRIFRSRTTALTFPCPSAHATDAWPFSFAQRKARRCRTSSCFGSLAESSHFFEGGSVGYSVTRGCCRLDGLRLQTDHWEVRPLAVEHVQSSFFADESAFPSGSVTFDHALIMRDVRHQWHEEADMLTAPATHTFKESAGRRIEAQPAASPMSTQENNGTILSTAGTRLSGILERGGERFTRKRKQLPIAKLSPRIMTALSRHMGWWAPRPARL